MNQVGKNTLEAVGAPARMVRNRLAVLKRRLVWRICWWILGILILWDVYLTLDGTVGNTWSEVMRSAGENNPVLPWILGAFLAHLFHPKDDLQPVIEEDAAKTVMATLTLLLFAWGWFGPALNGWQMAAATIFGMTASFLLWPKQRLAEWHW